MTLFWLKSAHPRNAASDGSESPKPEPEFDEDGRQYVFRYTPVPLQAYQMDRDRIFRYARTHELPSARARMMRRDRRNAASFYEDVREIQTHPDVVPLCEAPASLEPVARLRLRSAS